MKKISSKEKAYIRKLAQKIKPSFQIGAQGIHNENITAIKEGFNKKEILKIKVNREDKYDKTITKEIASTLEEKLKCTVAGVIGSTIIIYKENQKIDKENRIFN